MIANRIRSGLRRGEDERSHFSPNVDIHNATVHRRLG
jgi:hypothetical protein